MSDQPNTESTEVADEQKYKLSRPIVFEEVTYNELTLDFDKLKAKDMMQAERRLLMDTQETPVIKEMNKTYLAYIVASAASVPVELIHELYAKDFARVTIRAQNFLLR